MGKTLISAAIAVATLATGLSLPPVPAAAQSTPKTLKIAELLPLGVIDTYFGSYPQTQFMSDMIYDTLVAYDPETRTIVPLLAASWEQTSDAITFHLRQDVTWHDGQKFTASDAAYTLNWLVDPKSKYYNKFQWAWIKAAVKIDDYTVRVETDGERPSDLMQLAYAPIYPEHVRTTFPEPQEFGRHPVGTGPYKVVEYNVPGNHLVLARNPDYKWGGKVKAPTNIERVDIRTVPEQGAQVAGLMVGDFDFVRDLPVDQAEAMAKDPRFKLDVNPSIGTTYMWFDATGRAGNEALKNEKVRHALAMAVDRKELAHIMAGNEAVPLPESMCWPDKVQGCAYTKKVPGYDPVAAKKLLAEAGYPNGFEVRITSYVGRLTELGQAVAAYYSAIGVKATVEPVTVSTYTAKAASGKIQITVAGNSLTGMPDIRQTVSFFLDINDYTGDPTLLKLGHEADETMDSEKRLELARQFFDRINEHNYISPLTAMPQFFTHSSAIEMKTNSSNSYGVAISDIRWKAD
jgi:peptide/nickel transport system substrate-binding protein